MEVVVIVGDDEDGFAARFEVGQELGIEDVLEDGVLVGRPLVEDVDGAVFEVRDEQRQALLLAPRELRGGEDAALDADRLDACAPLTRATTRLLERASAARGLSARAIQSLRRVARTLADLEDEEVVVERHLQEALGLRAALD